MHQSHRPRCYLANPTAKLKAQSRFRDFREAQELSPDCHNYSHLTYIISEVDGVFDPLKHFSFAEIRFSERITIEHRFRMQTTPIIARSAIPSLETERLCLRGHCAHDLVECAAMWADPNVTRHILEHPLSEEEAWAKLLRYVGHWVLLGFGYWVVVEKQTGDFVGEAGFADYKRTIQPSLQGMPEIGWVLATRAHGKGFATEAVRAITAWGDAHFQTSTRCIITPENTASFRVAAKCGYREILRTIYKGREVVIFERELQRS